MLKYTVNVVKALFEVYGSFIVSPLQGLLKQRIMRVKPRSLTKAIKTSRHNWLPFGHARGLRRIPENYEPRVGTLVVQEHDASHHHYDVSIIDEDGRELFRGARTAKHINDIFPTDKIKKSWAQQPEHDSSYVLGFEGVIKEGYGAGTVKQALKTPVEIIKSTPDKISFHLYDEYAGQYAMMRKGTDWLVIKKKYDNRIPDQKFKFKSKTELELKDHIYEHKVDGHFTEVKLGEHNKVNSWRISKRTGMSINYDDKLPKIRNFDASDYKGTKLKCEMVFFDGKLNRGAPKLILGKSSHSLLSLQLSVVYPKERVFLPIGAERPAWLAGRLNSKVWKSREDFNNSKGNVALIILDIKSYKGKDITGWNYIDKIQLMDEIAKEVDFLYVPRRDMNGNRLWNKIVLEEGREGLVAKPLFQPSAYQDSDSIWVKCKNRDETDVRIIAINPLIRKSGIIDPNMMGSLGVTDGKETWNVGSGFSEFQRKFIMEHSNEILTSESVIKIRIDPKLEARRKPHAPSFIAAHPDKSDGIITEMDLMEYTNNDRNQLYAMKTATGWKR